MKNKIKNVKNEHMRVWNWGIPYLGKRVYQILAMEELNSI
jgi:hypothetical protein